MAAELSKGKVIVVCEELIYNWSTDQLEEIKRLWSEGYTIQQLSKFFARKRDEIVLALLDLLNEHGKAELFGDRWGQSPRRKPTPFLGEMVIE